MEIALKMAFSYWRLVGEPERDTFVTFTGAYHGDTIGSVSLGAIELFHASYRPLLFDAVRSPWPRPYRDVLHPDDPEACRDEALAHLARTLERHKGRVAAVVTEAYVQAADGIHVAPSGWMHGVENLCREHGALFVVDEVATGFCRTGKLLACELEGTRPDLLAVAKGLTGGVLPLAATLTTERIYEAFLGSYSDFRHFFHGHTYTGNPIACAAALANLDLIESSGLVRRLPATIAEFTRLLRALADHPHVGEIRQLGMMVGIELVRSKQDRSIWDPAEMVPQRIVAAARERGAVIRPLGNVMVLMPPPAMPVALLAELVRITHESIDVGTR
jgi:adenosylmethionine-8-amino-7-oxononanoate aminotransferase